MHELILLVPLLILLLICTALAFWQRRCARGGFVHSYFIGSRTVGGGVLAMTTIATYVSVSFFVGGPGQAWDFGFSWVYMAVSQVATLLLAFGVLGKKLALIGRRIDAVTIVDVIRARYRSDAVASLTAVVMVLFFMAMMVAQFVGGALVFQAVTGYSYAVGLLIFGGAVIIFTTVGGFRGVAVTDAICGIAILVAVIILGGGILIAGGGYDHIMNGIAQTQPWLLEPTAGGSMTPGLYLSQWLLLGMFALVLPQTTLRALGARDSASIRRAIVIGTAVLGAIVIGTLSLGILAHGVLPPSAGDFTTVDSITPLAIMTTLPPWLAGLCIVGPIAASISTMSSLLIMASSAVVKDTLMRLRERQGRIVPQHHVVLASQAFTFGVGIVVVILALTPPTTVWWIDMFAIGGLEAAFLWVMVLGLFWRRANKYGAIASIASGVITYCLTAACGMTFLDLHQIVIGSIVSLACMVLGSLATPTDDSEEVRDVFFPE